MTYLQKRWLTHNVSTFEKYSPTGHPLNSRPMILGEHGLNAPAWAKDVERLGEAVIVDESGVSGEEAHHQDDVAALKECGEELRKMLDPGYMHVTVEQ